MELPEERRIKVLQIIRRRGSITVAELSKELKVSGITIRRDLKKLEAIGHIKCTYGGALLLQRMNKELSFDQKIVVNINKKRKIGAKAALLIEENDTIFVSTGTTTREVVLNIDMRKNVTVATNCLWTGYELSKLPNVHLGIIGGELLRPSYALVGPKALRAIEDIVIDKFFLSLDGISIDYGTTTTSEFEAEIIRTIIKLSKRTIIVADSTKIGRVAFARIGGLDDIDIIVTDSGLDKEQHSALTKHVEVVIA